MYFLRLIIFLILAIGVTLLIDSRRVVKRFYTLDLNRNYRVKSFEYIGIILILFSLILMNVFVIF